MRALRSSLCLALFVSATAPQALAQWTTVGDLIYTFDRVNIGTQNSNYSVGIVAEDSLYGALRVENPAGGFGERGIYSVCWTGNGADATALQADSYSNNGGIGVLGRAVASSGVNYGVKGQVNSSDGYSGHFAGGQFHVTSEFAGFNRDFKINSTEVFGVTAKTHSWGGMYMTTWSGGKPYYGYGIDNTYRAYHYWDEGSRQWRLVAGAGRITADSQSGNVGIGTNSPGFKLHVNGSAGKPGGGSWSTASDLRLKKDVRPLEGALDRLLEIRGVAFEYIDPDAVNELHGERLGVIAQEVERVFPDWVEDGEDGYKRVTFRGFEGVAVEAMRELRSENEELREELAANRAALEQQQELLRQLAERLESLEER